MAGTGLEPATPSLSSLAGRWTGVATLANRCPDPSWSLRLRASLRQVRGEERREAMPATVLNRHPALILIGDESW
jgi:hypothetical protein